MSMKYEGKYTAYRCTECGAVQLVLEGEQPDECMMCNGKGNALIEAEKDKLRLEGAASVLFPKPGVKGGDHDGPDS